MGTKLGETAEKVRRPPNAGKGRPKGIPNKATGLAREAIARLVDGNAERMQGWLDQIAETEGPLRAWQCLADVIEYHVPKLSRSEINGTVTVRTLAEELSELNKK